MAYQSENPALVDPKVHEVSLHLPKNALKMKTPARLLISGVSGSGKTSMILSMIKNMDQYFDAVFEFVYLCIPNNCTHFMHETLDKYKLAAPFLTIREGLLHDFSILTSKQGSVLLIVEDLYLEALKSESFCNLTTFSSRKCNVSIILTSQNLTFSTPHSLTIRRQFMYLIIFFSHSDNTLLVTVGRALNPLQPNYLIKAMRKVCQIAESPFQRFLFIDSHPMTALPLNMRVRGNILNQDVWFLLHS